MLEQDIEQGGIAGDLDGENQIARRLSHRHVGVERLLKAQCGKVALLTNRLRLVSPEEFTGGLQVAEFAFEELVVRPLNVAHCALASTGKGKSIASASGMPRA